MAEKTEDLNLPLAVITRIIKDALPDGVIVSREARVAIARAASVFVLYATATANGYASKAKRKTLSANDVIGAMKDMEFEELVEPLLDALNSWKQSCKAKKMKPAPSTKSKTAPEADQDEENIETIDLEESGEYEEEENHIARESDADDSENAED